MEIGAVITKARDMYCNDDVIFPAQCGVTEDADCYWVEAYLRVPKNQLTAVKSLSLDDQK
jgi:hypothetical protein